MNTHQQNDDKQHLKLLSIFHYIVGGLLVFLSLFPLIHLSVGIVTITSDSSENVPLQVGYLFAAFGAISFLLGEACAIATIVSGRFLKRRKRYWFSFVMACILCLFMPLGTILGIFTIIVLSRPSVKELYSLSSAND